MSLEIATLALAVVHPRLLVRVPYIGRRVVDVVLMRVRVRGYRFPTCGGGCLAKRAGAPTSAVGSAVPPEPMPPV